MELSRLAEIILSAAAVTFMTYAAVWSVRSQLLKARRAARKKKMQIC